MADTRGVFGLKIARILKSRGEWNPLDQVWHSPSPGIGSSPNNGYIGGGTPDLLSTMEKLDFSTETRTAVPSANLTVATYGLAATGNATHGYFGGGVGGPYTTVQKTTYSSDTTVQVPGAALSNETYYLAATGNNTQGYFGGGYNGRSNFDKITYTSDTRTTLPNVSGSRLTTNKERLAATGNSTAAYFGGGVSGPPSSAPIYSTMDKLTYASDTSAAIPGAALSAARYSLCATGNANAGYFAGGDSTPGGSYSGAGTIADKVTYASDTTARVPSADLLTERIFLAATGNSTHGYFSGGVKYGANYSSTEKITYATDTTSTVPSGADLSSNRNKIAATGARANGNPVVPAVTPAPSSPATRFTDGSPPTDNNAFFGGGKPGPKSTMDKLDYSTTTTAAAPGANLTIARYGLGATSSLSGGYFSGGNPGSKTEVEKLTYSTTSIARIPSADFPAGRFEIASVGNRNAGYYAGGATAVIKLTYSSDTSARIPSANLTFPSTAGTGVGNETHGYIGGGQSSPNTTKVDKLDYSNDTTSSLPSAAYLTSPGMYKLGATGNSTAGYFGGGSGPVRSTVDKLTYSSDSTSRIPGANLSSSRYTSGATGNPSSGFFGGGAPGTKSTMDKIDFSSDTTEAVPGAALTVARSEGGSTSARGNALPINLPPTATPSPSTFASTPNQAVFAGGISNSTTPSEKFLYSTETFSQIPGTLTASRYGHASVSSSSAVYFGGGYGAAPYPFESTIVDKYTYSNDSISRSPSSNLSDARRTLAAVGNNTHGYFGGGAYQSTYKTVVERIVYSNDSESRIPGANLGKGRRELSACGNLTAGYFIGGFNNDTSPSDASEVDKLTYASDTAAAVPGAFTPSGVYTHNSTGSPSVGYIGGGAGKPSDTEKQFDKLTYSTDTTAAAPAISFPSYETNYGAVSNTDVAYFTINNPAVLKLEFSSDTLSTIPATSSTYFRNVGSGARDNGIGLSPNII